MSIKNVKSALTQAYIDAGLGLPTAYENQKFDPTSYSLWSAVSFLPSLPEATSLGEGGIDTMNGIFQIDLFASLDLGEDALLGYVDSLRLAFTAGQRFVYLSQEVLIEGCGMASAFKDSNYHRIPVSVIWTSRLTRASLT